MRILIVIGDSKFGGATYLILAWCRFLLNQGCNVSVLSTDPQTLSALRLILRIDTIDSIRVTREINPSQNLVALARLTSLLHRRQYDVVHTHTSTPGVVGRIAGWLAQIPVVLHTAHGWPVTEFSNGLARILYSAPEYIAGMAATKVICVSHATEAYGRRFHLTPGGKLLTVCNGIDPKPFVDISRDFDRRQQRQLLGLSESDFVIGATGRLAEQKDPWTLIKAVKLLVERLPDRKIRLLIAGEGPLQEEMRFLTHELGLDENVRFLGFWQEIPLLLATIDVFASTSLWEGLSISIMEAMASAVPIVTTNILPNAELIEHEVTGLLVPPKSPERIADAVARFAHEPDLAQSCAAAARQHVLEHYTIDRMFQETWALYMNLLEQSKKAQNKKRIG